MELKYYPKQGRFIHTPAHSAAFVGGIGSGKSIAGAIRALLASQGYVGKLKVLQTPNLGVVTAPTYVMLRDASLRAFLETCGAACVDYNKSDYVATMANGSEVLFRSTDAPDRLRGPSIAWWWGDEAAMYTPDVWNIMIGRLRQYGERGYSWITSTPRGRNWLWQRFIRDNETNDDYFVIKARSKDNPFLDPAIAAEWAASYVGDFARQELDAEFVAFEGLIYPEFDRALHITTHKPTAFKQVVAGVDWGFANPGVILVVGIDSDGRGYLLHEEYRRQRQIDEWATVANQLTNTWHIETFYCDPSEPEHIKKFNAQPAIRGKAQAADNSVTPGIQAVKARLMKQGDNLPRLFIPPSAVNTISEFESYQWAENKYGIRDEPLKSGDHAMDALRYVLYNIEKRQPVKVEIRHRA